MGGAIGREAEALSSLEPESAGVRRVWELPRDMGELRGESRVVIGALLEEPPEGTYRV